MSHQGDNWMAGAATRDFAVVVGTPMEGYAARTGPSTGTLDTLQIGAHVLSNSDQRVVIMTADVAAVDTALVNEIAASAGIDRSELVVCASHTHSGPAGIVPNLHPSDLDQTDPSLRTSFITTCVATIEDAFAGLEPVELLFGRSNTTELAANRNRADGPYDGQVSVLATRTQSGSFQSVLVHFACHPTILGATNLAFSADFPGVFRRSLSASLEVNGQRPTIMFANGAAGDVSTRYTRKSQDMYEVDRVGKGLATAAGLALRDARKVSRPLRHERMQLQLTPRSFDEQADFDSPRDDRQSSEPGPAQQRREEVRLQGANLLAKLKTLDPDLVRTSLDIEAWALGDIALVAIPGELFASLGGQISSVAPSSPTLVLGYANGYVGYLADEDAYEKGTYEALASPYGAGSGERVAQAACNLLLRIRGKPMSEPRHH